MPDLNKDGKNLIEEINLPGFESGWGTLIAAIARRIMLQDGQVNETTFKPPAVRRVTFNVTPADGGKEDLRLVITTNGSVTPQAALYDAVEQAIDHLSDFKELI